MKVLIQSVRGRDWVAKSLPSSQVPLLLVGTTLRSKDLRGPTPSSGQECWNGLYQLSSSLREFFKWGYIILKTSVIPIHGWRVHKKALGEDEFGWFKKTENFILIPFQLMDSILHERGEVFGFWIKTVPIRGDWWIKAQQLISTPGFLQNLSMVSNYNHEVWGHEWVCISALPPAICKVLGKFSNLPRP